MSVRNTDPITSRLAALSVNNKDVEIKILSHLNANPSRLRNRSANTGRMPSTPPMPRGSGHTKQDTAQPISHMPYGIYCG
jgi:hypothetical protein